MRTLRFHQGFSLNRQRLSGMVRCIADGQATSDEAVGAYMGVNPYMVEGFRGWLCKAGLGQGTSKHYTFTPFGQLVAIHDPDLRAFGTLWLLHYYLASQHAERAEVWYRCFNEFLRPGLSFAADELQAFVVANLEQLPKNKNSVADDTKELVKTYTSPAALGDLHLLVKDGTSLTVGDIRIPDSNIVAYVLFDSWNRSLGESDTVRLSQICESEETVGKVFVADSHQVQQYIGMIQRLGLVNYADTQHEQVTRRFHDEPVTLLQRYYQSL